MLVWTRGVIFVPVYVVAAAIQWAIFHLTSVPPLVALDGRHGAVTAFLALLIGGVGAHLRRDRDRRGR